MADTLRDLFSYFMGFYGTFRQRNVGMEHNESHHIQKPLCVAPSIRPCTTDCPYRFVCTIMLLVELYLHTAIFTVRLNCL